MKSIFNPEDRAELIWRIEQLTPESKNRWGKMNLHQMIRHCLLTDEMNKGKMRVKRAFLGRLLGRSVLKAVIKNEKPFAKNIGTLPPLKVTEAVSGDLAELKQAWIESVQSYGDLSPEHRFTHSFFGKMDYTETGRLAYKHTDHHLRQFGV